MTVRLDSSFLVVHALGLKGRATPAALAAATGLDPSEVDRVLGLLLERRIVESKPGGWALTGAGRAEHRDALERGRSGDDGAGEAINHAYRRFRALNEPLKALCTDWQLRDGDPRTPNDHTDPLYDRHVIERLDRIHDDVLGVVGDLARAAPRFAPYRQRLESAHTRVRTGDVSALTAPLADSYHDVWMELHEDLLLTLGIERHEGVS